MSPALLDEQWVDYLFFSTVKEIKIPKIFLVYHSVNDSDWKNYQVAFKKTFEIAKHQVKWPQGKTLTSRKASSKDKSSLPMLEKNLSTACDTSPNDKLSATDQLTITEEKSTSDKMPSPNVVNNWFTFASLINRIVVNVKNIITSWQEKRFWKTLRLALPKPMSSRGRVSRC